MNGCCFGATGLLSVLMQPVHRKRQQEPFALPLPMEPLAHRVHGARAGNSQTCRPGAYTLFILIVFSDIVRMCTVARRCGLGTIVWLAYDCAAFHAPCKANPTEIWCGTKLVAFNAQGARALHARILDSKPGRDDLWLRSELEISA